MRTAPACRQAGIGVWGLFYWFYSEVLAYFPCKVIVDFCVPWYRGAFVLTRIPPPGVTGAFSDEFTTLFPEVFQYFGSFHARMAIFSSVYSAPAEEMAS